MYHPPPLSFSNQANEPAYQRTSVLTDLGMRHAQMV